MDNSFAFTPTTETGSWTDDFGAIFPDNAEDYLLLHGFDPQLQGNTTCSAYSVPSGFDQFVAGMPLNDLPPDVPWHYGQVPVEDGTLQCVAAGIFDTASGSLALTPMTTSAELSSASPGECVGDDQWKWQGMHGEPPPVPSARPHMMCDLKGMTFDSKVQDTTTAAETSLPLTPASVAVTASESPAGAAAKLSRTPARERRKEERPERCPECPNKGFQYKADLHKHIAAKHPEVAALHNVKVPPLSVCEDCGRAYTRKDRLLRHQTDKHRRPKTDRRGRGPEGGRAGRKAAGQ
ncbi:hypothetical protein VTJ49DRAFT_4408 [Mycothermus thermophilus]|uniref:C2H2-type domain-containing protein n=1 Tax=Humicola insolens TaxID=85995 RepID=A0ABR3V5J5_HUMIN